MDIPFSVHTAAANGALLDHTASPAAAIHVDTGRSTTRVVVRRHLGRIFDGVDFAQMQPAAIASQILQSLIDHVDVEITAVHEDA